VTDPSEDEKRELRERINRQFEEGVPHNRALGMELLELGEGGARNRLPWAPHLVGDPETGVIHGGVITSLLDACCGAAVFQALGEPQPIATLDLRIDYMKPATPKVDVHGVARVTKVTRNVAFVRATAYQETEDNAVATATATFMLGTPAQRRKDEPGR
jgi:uncharacterized protein (TIGR00369 family)